MVILASDLSYREGTKQGCGGCGWNEAGALHDVLMKACSCLEYWMGAYRSHLLGVSKKLAMVMNSFPLSMTWTV